MGLGKNIRARRKALNMTLVQVAEAIGWDDGNLSRLEREIQGTTEERLEKIASVLGTTIAGLYSENGPLEEWEKNIEPGPPIRGKYH